ncbi:hypothetical protein NQ314_001660 [Rhamnusium bicolor]|uniref:Uncharacterized protein n=1 Tax=Rhamnusium bicolor TaxID=1586634 RepID=A0AAV8ZTJ1_9CUCU|nr:hypothetical protein NQ314_001660 [Rhamnusium bicolor]
MNLHENFCSNNKGNARMGDGNQAIQELKVCLISFRRLVYGFWNRFDIYIPFLALTGLWRITDAFRSGISN